MMISRLLTILILSLILSLPNSSASQYQSYRRKRAECPPAGVMCSLVNCQNGGQCVDDTTTADCFKCNCVLGYTGKICDTVSPVLPTGCNPGCQNGGICNVNICQCPVGYSGTFCEIKDNCVPINPCSNGGKCISIGGSFACDCTGTGYGGALCTELILTNPCLSTPCLNNGLCSWDGTTMSCTCVNGYLGTFCQIAPIPCSGLTCQNGGKCGLIATNTYGCICEEGYTGTQCETSISINHPCVTMPTVVCKNGGICAVDNNDYKCNCATGWTGRNCETAIAIVTACNPNPCSGHGTCIEANSGSGTIAICNCDANWTGRFCDVNMNGNCPPGYCLSGGICRMNGNIAYCDCPALYTGARCETLLSVTTIAPGVTLCPTNTCQNGGTCYIINSVTVCNCPPNWTGSTCNIAITTTQPPVVLPCTSSPCQNGGTCYNYQNAFGCACAPNWGGPTCAQYIPTVTTTTATTVATSCSPNPCLNSGVCYAGPTSFHCQCISGWTGIRCETAISSPIKSCSSQPCKNGGQCYDSNAGYSCVCQAGYAGANCEAIKAANCPLNCLPGDCIFTGSTTKPYACVCNGVMKLTSCT